jgi:hypothetical protein
MGLSDSREGCRAMMMMGSGEGLESVHNDDKHLSFDANRTDEPMIDGDSLTREDQRALWYSIQRERSLVYIIIPPFGWWGRGKS